MGFGKMDRDAVTYRNINCLGQIIFYLTAVVVLKEFRIGPVKIGLVKDLPGYGYLSAETFK